MGLIPKSSLEALFWAVVAVLMHGLTIIGVVLFNLWKKTVFAGSYDRNTLWGFGKYNRFAGRILAGLIGYMIGFFVMVGMTVLKHYAVIANVTDQIMTQWQGYVMWSSIPFVTGFFIQLYLDSSTQSNQSAWRQGYRKRIKNTEASVENRRSDERIEITQPVTLTVEKSNYACNLLEVSLSGAKLDRKINYPLGSKAQLDIPKLGNLDAFIIRKAKTNTFLKFPYLDGNTKENFAAYIDRLLPVNQATA